MGDEMMCGMQVELFWQLVKKIKMWFLSTEVSGPF
jgi:hypothetical protein